MIAMKISETDFYTGFEGEPELVFIRETDGRQRKLTLWEGYFDTLMTQEENLSASGHWMGLALSYHSCLGCWGDGQENWRIPNIKEALDQLKTLDVSGKDDQVAAVLNALIWFLTAAINEDAHVFIARF
jgi:hypothetical protein